MRSLSLILLLLAAGLSLVHAESAYVVDRVLLGVHSGPAEENPLIASVPSGTRLEILQRGEAFSQVRLPDGKTGWIMSSYLMQDKPATAQLDELLAKHKQLIANLKSMQEQMAKKERELQVRRDELSNARTTIRDLKKQAGKPVMPVDTKMAEELAAANQEVENLRQQIARLKAAPPVTTAATPTDQQQIAERLHALEQENAALRGRIELAVARLSGAEIPSPEEIALLKPRLPGWVWGMLALMLILGIGLGIFGFDYWHRRRHGGFRI
jgi:SH3 domain protein